MITLRPQSESRPNHSVPNSEEQNIYQEMDVCFVGVKVKAYHILCISAVWTSICGKEKSAQQRLVRNKGLNLLCFMFCFSGCLFLLLCSSSDFYSGLAVLLCTRNHAAGKASGKAATTATDPSNRQARSSSRRSPACCLSTKPWGRLTCTCPSPFTQSFSVRPHYACDSAAVKYRLSLTINPK